MAKKDSGALHIYYCGREQCSPGHSWGPAIRPHYLLHVILKGKGTFHYKEKEWHLTQGDAFLIRPMEIHLYQADQEDPWEYAWVGFDGSMVLEMLEETAFANSLVFQNASTDPGSAMTQLVQTFLQPERRQLDLLAHFFHLLSLMPLQEGQVPASFEENYYKDAVTYIRNNYTYDLKIQDIADYVGIDRTYLYKLFMKNGNLSPKQYLMQYRIRQASKLLQSQKYTVTETAYSCGFRDSAAFCNHFRQQVGMTPRQYKEHMKAGDL